MKPFVYFTLGYRYHMIKQFILRSEDVYAFEFGFPTENPVYDGMKLRRTHDPSVNMYNENENTEVFRMADEVGSRK